MTDYSDDGLEKARQSAMDSVDLLYSCRADPQWATNEIEALRANDKIRAIELERLRTESFSMCVEKNNRIEELEAAIKEAQRFADAVGPADALLAEVRRILWAALPAHVLTEDRE